MTSFKEKARNRFDIFVSMLAMVFLFWFPAYNTVTIQATTLGDEYASYFAAWRKLCLMMYFGDYLDEEHS